MGENHYDYETYYDVVDKVFERDNFRCQICGYYGISRNKITTTRCLECERLAKEDITKNGLLNFHPDPEQAPPKPCKNREKYRFCGECPEFLAVTLEYRSYQNILAHHLDGNKRNQDLENLVTVCQSCHHKIHGIERQTGKLPTLEEAREHLTHRKNGAVKNEKKER